MLVPKKEFKITKKDFTSYDTKNLPKPNPSIDTYNVLVAAYELMNQELFDGILPNCMITLQRKNGAYGYFKGDGFINKNDETLTDEIALNPKACATRSFKANISTLSHEMVHQWQFHHSEHENRRNTVRSYHDKEWADKMESIGLIPTDTGKAGGKKTGRNVSHFILEGGVFDRLSDEMESRGWNLSWREWIESPRSRRTGEQGESPEGLEGFTESKIQDKSKQKFSCPACGQNAWAKLSAQIACAADKCNGVRMQLNAPNAP